MGVTRTAARRFAVALVAVLLFVAWLAAFALLLMPRPRAIIFPEIRHCQYFFSADSSLLVTWNPQTGLLEVWDVFGQHQHSIPNLEKVLLSPRGTWLAGNLHEGDIKVWDVRSGQVVYSVKPVYHPNSPVAFRFTPDGKYLVVSDHGRNWAQPYVTFHDVTGKQQPAIIQATLDSLAFSRDGTEVIAWYLRGGAEPVRVQGWHITDREPALTLVTEIEV
jgi:WD40 repeat protein